MGKISSDDVADWIIAFHQTHGDPITNLRLQKLMYYAQAWHLAIHGEALFDEDFEAWIHGPVIRRLYGQYKHFGSAPIDDPKVTSGDDDSTGLPPVSPDVQKHLEEVMNAYGSLSTWDLERLTHEEKPWIDARCEKPIDEPCTNKIDRQTMREFYAAKLV